MKPASQRTTKLDYSMEPEFDSKLEALLNSELKALPPLKAPSSLAPNVMAILAARARIPWWQRAWWDWPLSAKAAFVVLAITAAGAMGGGGHFLGEGAVGYSTDLMERFNPAEGVFWNFVPLVDAATLVWERFAQPFLLYGALLAGALYLMFVGVGTVCFRFAVKRI